MYTIYADPSELRSGTSLPNVESYTSTDNLEFYTGADFLVSPWDDLPIPLKRDFPPHRIILARHCWSGCLIQRKSGADLLSSLNHLDHILYRMSQWCQNPWLVYTNIRESRNGLATVVNSRRKSRWNWESVRGKLNSWQHRGGSVQPLLSDDDIYGWLESIGRAVDKWQEEPEKLLGSKIPQQPITIRAEEQNYFNTLRIIPPGVGEKTVENLITYVATELHLPPTALNLVRFACSEESLKVRGWGKTRMMDMRNWVGYNDTVYYKGILYKLENIAISDLTKESIE